MPPRERDEGDGGQAVAEEPKASASNGEGALKSSGSQGDRRRGREVGRLPWALPAPACCLSPFLDRRAASSGVSAPNGEQRMNKRGRKPSSAECRRRRRPARPPQRYSNENQLISYTHPIEGGLEVLAP